MLLRAGAEKDLQNIAVRTVLIEAACEGHTGMTQLLLQAGAEKDARHGLMCSTALMEAASNGHTEIAQLLLQAAADTDLQNKAGRTALMEAARIGHTEIVQLLLQTGAETALKVSDGCYRYTALVEAASNGHTEVVRLLLLQACAEKEGSVRQDSAGGGSQQGTQGDYAVAAASWCCQGHAAWFFVQHSSHGGS